jgi:chorismate mutase
MNELDELRAQIDQLDKEIIAKMAKRQHIVEVVRKYKQQHNIAIFDQKREEYLEIYHTKLSKEYGVSIEFIQKLFKLIMDESKRLQNK